MATFKTDIVDTQRPQNKFLVFGFSILYIAATIYIFLLRDDYPNEYLSIGSFVIYVIGAFILFRISFIKPKTLGTISFGDDALEIIFQDEVHNINFSSLNQLKLNYSDYAKWSMNVWGSNNFLEIETEDGTSFNFEILIKSEQQKNKMKKIFKSSGLKDKFTLRYLNGYDLQVF